MAGVAAAEEADAAAGAGAAEVPGAVAAETGASAAGVAGAAAAEELMARMAPTTWDAQKCTVAEDERYGA